MRVIEKPNEHPSVAFLRSLYQYCDEGFINLRFLPSAQNRFIPPSEIDSIPGILETHKRENAYFGVATRVDGDGTKAGILQIPVLSVDPDLYKLSDKQKEESRQRLRDFLLEPTYVINSGGGRYLFWMLKEPASKEDVPRVENLLRRLAAYFHGDMAATDASRILRMPGSVNHKYEHIPRVTIESSLPERQYNLDDFEILPPGGEIHSGERIPTLSAGWEKELLGGVPEGERNNAITRLVGRYFGKGISRDEIFPILLDANSRFNPPLPLKEIEAVLNSVIKTHQRNHPDLPQERENSRGVSYRLTTLLDVFEYPEPTFLIDQILVEGTISVLGAYTGVGKSVVSLSIIKSILTGDPLWGKFQVVKAGPVLLVDEETPRGFLRDRIEKMGFERTLPFYFLHFQDVKLDRDDCFNALMEKIEEVKPVLVIIDSLIRVHRQKEDDATSMSRVLDRLRKIANFGTTLLVIHHHKKGDGPLSQKLRGSSDIPGGVDVEYALTPKDDFLVFCSVKTRIKPLTPIRLKMETEDGLNITYQGDEIGERGEILNEVLSILREGELGVMEIHKALIEKGFEVGVNNLRGILKGALGKELIEEKGLRGKRTYRKNPASQLHTPIYSRETVKLESNRGSSLTETHNTLRNGREGQSLDNQGLAGSFTASRRPMREGEKLDVSTPDDLHGTVTDSREGREAEINLLEGEI